MPVREILLLLIVGAVCLAAPFKPRFGLYGYIWFALLRPDVLAWAPDKYPLSMALAVATLLGAIRYIGSTPSVLRSPVGRWLLALQAPLAASTVFAVTPDLSYDLYLLYLRSLLIALLIPMLIETPAHFRELLYVMSFSLGFLAAKLGVYGLWHGGVDYSGQSWGSQHDNNLLTLGLVMVIPICWYCRRLSRSTAFKLVQTVFTLGVVATTVMSGSRGCVLALAAVSLVMLWHCRQRVAGFVVLSVMLGGSIWLVQDEFVGRLATLEHYEQDASAVARLEHMQAAVAMWQDYPLLGVGFGGRNYAQLAERYLGRESVHVAHNSYLQMLADSGVVAFLIYCGLLFGSIVWLGRSARQVARGGTGLEAIPRALQGTLIAFAVGSCFYSVQRYDFLYFALMGVAGWHNVVKPVGSAGQAPADQRGDLLDESYWGRLGAGTSTGPAENAPGAA